MNVLDAQIDWKEDVLNDPRIEVLVDETPHTEEMRFVHDESTDIWYAEDDGFVRYYHWSGPGNEGGFGGTSYQITTVDGETVTLKGPWSSRAGVVNQIGFGPVVEVKLTTDPEVMEKGYTFRARSITLEAAKEALRHEPEALCLEKAERNGEPRWIPVKR